MLLQAVHATATCPASVLSVLLEFVLSCRQYMRLCKMLVVTATCMP
jgi:hypothetical protein